MFCTHYGTQISDNARFCTGCGAKKENDAAKKPSIQASSISPPSIKSKAKGSRSILLIAGILFGVILLIGASLMFLLPARKQLKLGPSRNEISTQIHPNGGTLEIRDDASPLDGLTIYADPGSFGQELTFDVSSTEIKSHNFGNLFSPVTPLITIHNGHLFSNKPLRVQIPLELNEDEFAMGFFYDRQSGKLEAIPFSSYAPDNIVLLTHHFSDIVVSKVAVSELEKLSVNGNVSAKTDFEPGKDDWQFPNYGSAIAPGGHCAGQSLTMAWYYHQKHQTEKKPKLFGRFDNNGMFATADFWHDDSAAYRFASVIQESINWNSQPFHNYMAFSSINQRKVFYAFSYAIQITGQPQFMGINSFDDNGVRTGGHAIVAYSVENGRIYVADPNYPGQKDRYCEIGTDGFKPYSSGANAADISESGATLYTEMHFIASSALIDFAVIADQYDKMLQGIVGENLFPETEYAYLAEYNATFEQTVWQPVDGTVTLPKEYMDALPSEYKNKTIIRVTPKSPALFYMLYLGQNTQPEENPSIEILDGSIYYEIDIYEGSNDIGFYVEQQTQAGHRYVDFKRIRINSLTKSLAPTKAPTPTNSPQKTGSVKIACTYHSNYDYSPEIYEKEFAVGDPFPYDHLDFWLNEISGHRFEGYFTDEGLTQPLNYTTVPGTDVYVYARFTKMTLNEMLGRYHDESPESYLDHNYYDFLPNGIVKHYYKYNDGGKAYIGSGTWSVRETPYQKYSITSFDVKMESSSFPLHFVVYDGSVRESSGKIFYKN